MTTTSSKFRFGNSVRAYLLTALQYFWSVGLHSIVAIVTNKILWSLDGEKPSSNNGCTKAFLIIQIFYWWSIGTDRDSLSNGLRDISIQVYMKICIIKKAFVHPLLLEGFSSSSDQSMLLVTMATESTHIILSEILNKLSSN